MKATNGEASDFATDMTMLTDVEFGPDGNLYAVSFGRFEPNPPGIPFVPNAGSIIRVTPSGVKETVLSGLNYPPSIDFNENGDAFVAENGLLTIPGTGRVVRYPQLTRFEAQ